MTIQTVYFKENCIDMNIDMAKIYIKKLSTFFVTQLTSN